MGCVSGHLGLRGVVTRRAARCEIKVRPGRGYPEDARNTVCVRGSVTSPRSRHCCHTETAPCCASSQLGPREPRHPASPRGACAPRVALTCPDASPPPPLPLLLQPPQPPQPRLARAQSSRSGRGPGPDTIGHALTNQRWRQQEWVSMTQTGIPSNQSLKKGARLREGAALVLPSVPHRVRGGEAWWGGVQEWTPRKMGRAPGQLPRGIGGAKRRGGSCSLRSRGTRRSDDWILHKTSNAFGQ